MTKKSTSLVLKTRHYRWFPPQDHFGYKEQITDHKKNDTALMLVDVYLPDQYDPGRPEEEQYSSLSAKDYALWRRKIEQGIIPVVRAARSAAIPIIYVCNANIEIGMQHSAYAKKIEQSLGFQVEEAFEEIELESERKEPLAGSLNFLDGVAPQKGDYFIGKTVYSGFFNTALDSLLRNLQVKTLITAGFRLDACLLGTVLDALYRNYQVILIRDATLACELPNEIDAQQFTERMTLHFEALIGDSMLSEDFIRSCNEIS